MKIPLYILILFACCKSMQSQEEYKNQYEKLLLEADKEFDNNELSRAKDLYNRATNLKLNKYLTQFSDYASFQVEKIDSIIYIQDSILFLEMLRKHGETVKTASYFDGLPFSNYKFLFKENHVSKEVKYRISDSVKFKMMYPNGLYKRFNLNGDIVSRNSHNSLNEFEVLYIYDTSGNLIGHENIDGDNETSYMYDKRKIRFDFIYKDTLMSQEQSSIFNINYKTKDTISTEQYFFTGDLLDSVTYIFSKEVDRTPNLKVHKFQYNDNELLVNYTTERVYSKYILFDSINYLENGLIASEFWWHKSDGEILYLTEFVYEYEFYENNY